MKERTRYGEHLGNVEKREEEQVKYKEKGKGRLKRKEETKTLIGDEDGNDKVGRQ